jgi:hypothetical protein
VANSPDPFSQASHAGNHDEAIIDSPVISISPDPEATIADLMVNSGLMSRAMFAGVFLVVGWGSIEGNGWVAVSIGPIPMSL